MQISTPLWARLSSRFDSKVEIEEIAADPALKAEAKRVAPVLWQRAKGAGDDAVRRALQPLVLVYGVGDAARVPAFWTPYRVLADLPPEALRLGIEDYTGAADSQFFPKPGPLRALCEKHAEPIRRAADRAGRAAHTEAPRPRRDPTEDEKAQIARMVAETTAALTSTAKLAFPHSNVDLPSIAGKPDAGGLTPAMRELIARRNGDA